MCMYLYNIGFQGNLRSWLLNPNCNDQFCVIYGGGVKTAVANNTSKGPKLVLDREVNP